MNPKINEDRIVNSFETWCWRRMLKIKCIEGIAKDEVYQTAKEEVLLLKEKLLTYQKI
jgi:hypothetical protein